MDLTRRNPGCPWHIILAWIFMNLLHFVSSNLYLNSLIVLFVGIGYEIYQKEIIKRGGLEDLVADIIGIALGIIL